ncbi:MAG: NAD-dependent epimerase/dehydratase family protein [Coxiellaceae bacterium]|nr:NAD-dependent epimerase/dehydratase family protein [Coxiellaceae bacterium]
MIVLLTGATGFLGSNILKMLLKENHQVIILKRSFSKTIRIEAYLSEIIFYNLDELLSLEEVFKKNKIDVIVHCATDYGRKSTENTQLIHANLILPLQLLQLAKAFQVKAFLNTDTILDKRVNSYSLSKKQFIEWMDLYINDIICINLSLEHFYGPFDDSSKFLSHIIQLLIEGVPEIPLTPGEQERDFVYIDDVVAAFSLILKNLPNYTLGNVEHYEVGSGTNIKIKDLVFLAKEIIGNKSSNVVLGALSYRDNEIMCSQVDLKKITSLGWAPKVTLFEGLKKTVSIEKLELIS